MGIPSVTTNLSGFGCFMEDLLESPDVSRSLYHDIQTLVSYSCFDPVLGLWVLHC